MQTALDGNLSRAFNFSSLTTTSDLNGCSIAYRCLILVRRLKVRNVVYICLPILFVPRYTIEVHLSQ